MPKIVVSEQELKKIILESLQLEADAGAANTNPFGNIEVIRLTEDTTARQKFLGKLSSDSEVTALMSGVKRLTSLDLENISGFNQNDPNQFVSEMLWEAFTSLQGNKAYTFKKADGTTIATLAPKKIIYVIEQDSVFFYGAASDKDKPENERLSDDMGFSMSDVLSPAFRTIFEDSQKMAVISEKLHVMQEFPAHLEYVSDAAVQKRNGYLKEVIGQISQEGVDLASEYDKILYKDYVYEPLIFPKSWISIRDPESANTPWKMTAWMAELIFTALQRDGASGLYAIASNLDKYKTSGGIPKWSFESPPPLQENKLNRVTLNREELNRVIQAALRVHLNEGEFKQRIGRALSALAGDAEERGARAVRSAAEETAASAAAAAERDLQKDITLLMLENPRVKDFLEAIAKTLNVQSGEPGIKIQQVLQVIFRDNPIESPHPVAGSQQLNAQGQAINVPINQETLLSQVIDAINNLQKKTATPDNVLKEIDLINQHFDKLDRTTKNRIMLPGSAELPALIRDQARQIIQKWNASIDPSTSLPNKFALKLKIADSLNEVIAKQFGFTSVDVRTSSRHLGDLVLTLYVGNKAHFVVRGTTVNDLADRIHGKRKHTPGELSQAKTIIDTFNTLNDDQFYDALIRHQVEEQLRIAYEIIRRSEIDRPGLTYDLGHFTETGISSIFPSRVEMRAIAQQQIDAIRNIARSGVSPIDRINGIMQLMQPVRNFGAEYTRLTLYRASGRKFGKPGKTVLRQMLKNVPYAVGLSVTTRFIAYCFDSDDTKLNTFGRVLSSYLAAMTSTMSTPSVLYAFLGDDKQFTANVIDVIKRLLKTGSSQGDLTQLIGALANFRDNALPADAEIGALFPSAFEPGVLVQVYQQISDLLSNVNESSSELSDNTRKIMEMISNKEPPAKVIAEVQKLFTGPSLDADNTSKEIAAVVSALPPDIPFDYQSLEDGRKKVIQALIDACFTCLQDPKDGANKARAYKNVLDANKPMLTKQIDRVAKPSIGDAAEIESKILDMIETVFGDDTIATLGYATLNSKNKDTLQSIDYYSNLYGYDVDANYTEVYKAIAEAWQKQGEAAIKALSAASDLAPSEPE